MSDTLERRAVPRPVSLRAALEGDTGPGILTGYGAVFNSASRDLGGWYEEIDPGAFGEAIDESGAVDMTRHTRVIARSEHDSRFLLGTTDAGTLRLFLDDVGLRYEIDLPNTGAGRDAATLAERGDYAFSSFAFYTLPNGREWREDAEGRLISRVTAATLVDVAPVADPAYWGASTGMQRSLDLDAIRASLRRVDDVTGPEGQRHAVTARAHQFQHEIERSRLS